MVCHDHISVQLIEPEIFRAVKKGVNGETRDLWTPQVKGSGLLTLKKPVHRRKRPSRGNALREDPVLGKSSVESPGDENGAMLALEMRQPSFVETHD